MSREFLMARKDTGNAPTLKAAEKKKLLRLYEQASVSLAHMSREFEVITNEEKLNAYVKKAKENQVIAIDTETSSLNPLSSQMVGISLYTPGEKAVYIPYAHRDMETLELIPNQISKQALTNALQVVSTIKERVFFNSVFDVRTIKKNLAVQIDPTWDGYVAARLLNENERSNSLKDLYDKYVAKSGKVQKYADLFGGMGFTYVDAKVGGLYAAKDALMTYELYMFQYEWLCSPLAKRCDLEQIAKVFLEIEMPLQSIIAKIEDLGVTYDPVYGEELRVRYEQLLEERVGVFNALTKEVESEIRAYQLDYEQRRADKQDVRYKRLDFPVNYSSPTQVSILLYDIMGFSTEGRKQGEERSTGKAHLLRIDHPIAKALIDIAEIEKQLTTYIRKFPELARHDGRIHTQFNSVGADTLRFSSKNTNLQNLSAKNTDIRKAFRATHGYALISSDYSKQEIVIASALSNDTKMKEALSGGRDVYSEIASMIYHRPYEECTEEFGEDGAKRRYNAKQVTLSLLYGKQTYTLAKDLGISANEARQLVEKFFDSFSNLREWINSAIAQAKEKGYVKNIVGTKRRLPELLMPDYVFKPTRGNTVSALQQNTYTTKMQSAWNKAEREAVKAEALKEFIKIEDNTYKKMQAERQAVNAPVQSSASYMMKLAMLKIANDKQLTDLGYRMLIPIHDEILGEAPAENAKEAGQRVAYLMGTIAEDLHLGIGVSCDVEISTLWYENKKATYMEDSEDAT